jgi:hypothetical protein
MKNCSALEKVRHRSWLHLSRWRGKPDTNEGPPWTSGCAPVFGAPGVRTRAGRGFPLTGWVHGRRTFPRQGSRRTSGSGRPALTDFPGFTAARRSTA